MKKKLKKLKLSRETILNLQTARHVVGGWTDINTECARTCYPETENTWCMQYTCAGTVCGGEDPPPK